MSSCRTADEPSAFEAERVLVRLAAAGDEDAFAEIVAGNLPRVMSIARSMLRMEADAEEVAQDVFLKVHQKIGAFHAESRLSTWIYRITVNAARDHQRRRARDPKTLDEAVAVEAASPAEGPMLQASRRELVSEIREAIGSLSRRHRDLIILREIEGLEYDEIAATLGIPLGSVASGLLRARAKLRDVLERSLDSRGASARPASQGFRGFTPAFAV
jgi:RNA polymerase sigma-70 factor, ECF subfamily